MKVHAAFALMVASLSAFGAAAEAVGSGLEPRDPAKVRDLPRLCATPRAVLEAMDMVHHNPGEPLTESAFNDPAYLAARGYDAMVVNEFVFPQCVCTFDAFDPRIFPAGSDARAWALAARARLQSKVDACHAAGIRCYAFMDIIVLPKRLVELYRNELCGADGRISFDKPLTVEVHRRMLAELFEAVPGLDGIVVRTGETYLANTPWHVGNGPVDYKGDYEGSKAIHARLMNLLREEVCVKRGRRVYYRTWDFGYFHVQPDYYLDVTARVPVHSNLFMSVKHVKGDYLRTLPFNPTLGIGSHRQVVEVQCAREYEGKGAFVNYIGDSVINGFEECADDPGPKSLADLSACPLLAGIWTWSRGGGSCGPYLENELWCDMNATVLAAWAKNPAWSERDAFDAYADSLGVAAESRAAFRRLCLAAQRAIIRGRGTLLRTGADLRPYMKEPDNWLFLGWFRDDALGGERELKATMDGLIADGLLDARLDEMAQACAIWREIVTLARQVKCADAAAESYILTSALYGEALHRMMHHGCAVVFRGYAAKKAGRAPDARLILDQARRYDRARADLLAIRATRADAATVFRDDYPRYVNNDPAAPNNVLHGDGLGESVRRYRAACANGPHVRPATVASASFADFDARARAGENLTVVFFGGSLTWSANASEPNVTGFRGRMADYLAHRYPRAHFSFVDAAIGGTGSELGIFRLERDVLSKKPDLVFLDFSCNDGGGNLKIEPTCCYEYLLRRMIGEGIPVVQMFFTFKNWIAHGPPYDVEGCHLRLAVYRALAQAYGTGVGDVYTDGLAPKVESGELTVDDIWPLDGGHPCDLGYALFAEAGQIGFDRAVTEGWVCRVPEKPVFGTVEDVRRLDASSIEPAAKTAWRRDLTYRTSLWYDGLSSRWMDDVLVFSGADRAPLGVRAPPCEKERAGVQMFGVFGEADGNALTAEIRADGRKLTEFKTAIDARDRNGRLFFWRRAFCDAPAREFEIDPVPDGKGEFRIGAVCWATVVPNAATRRDARHADDSLARLDHARGGNADGGNSLRTAPPPRRGDWFEEARYGVFIHYGAYAVAARGEWVKNREKLTNEEYTELYAKNFKAEKLDCADWARKFKAWGFGYAVLTARHHDGYAMWDSQVNPYNCVKVGGAPDVVGEYVRAMRAEGLKVGLYYSPANWSHPDYPGPFFRDWPGVKDWKSEEARRRFVAYCRAELKELLDGYGPIDYLWFDGCIPENIDGAETLAWLRRDYPAMMVNNRLADGYDIKVCEQTINPPQDASVRWEACMTLNGNWGWHAGDEMWKSPVEVIDLLGRCAAKGGNLLLNVGPKADGTIPAESEAILDAVGAWLARNRTAYASTVRHPFTWNNTGAPITVKGEKVYITFLRDPKGSFRWAELKNRCRAARWVDDGTPVAFEQKDGLLRLKDLAWRAPGRIVELTVEGRPETLSPQTTFWIPE